MGQSIGIIYRSCNLLRYPGKDSVNITFTKDKSPLVLRNMISYKKGKNSSLKQVENEFYISEITNFRESEMFKYEYPVDPCGNIMRTTNEPIQRIKVFKNASGNKFYISYPYSSIGGKY
jgi:hypothetical protein